MLKELRTLMQMLDVGDEEEAPPAPVRPIRDVAAIEPPHSIEDVPRVVPPPRSFILDGNAAHADALSAMLGESGVESEIFPEAPAFVQALLMRPPAMVFLDVDRTGDGAIDALFAMGDRNYAGGVQIMGEKLSPVLDVVRRMGERHALQMLPVLQKPIERDALSHVLAAQNLRPMPKVGATLGEALARNWVEFWFQPKIDLRRRQIAGVETFARVRHPELGTLQPIAFLKGATESDLVRLAERALAAALHAAAEFARVGIHLRVAVNLPVKALIDLPIPRMVRELGPKGERWPGLLLDVTASQLAHEFARVEPLGPELAACNVRLAIDDFGRAELPVINLKALPIAELKLDRHFVDGCADNPTHARMCNGVIDLAHHLGCVAVAVGVERVEDLRVVAGMGCDVGQGFLFGQPMPEHELVALLLKRLHRQHAGQVNPAPASPAAPVTPSPPRPEPTKTTETLRPAKRAARRSSLRRAVWY